MSFVKLCVGFSWSSVLPMVSGHSLLPCTLNFRLCNIIALVMKFGEGPWWKKQHTTVNGKCKHSADGSKYLSWWKFDFWIGGEKREVLYGRMDMFCVLIESGMTRCK